MTEWKRPPHEMAEASRRAAAIWTHWDRNDDAGIKAVLEELDGADAVRRLVFGLLLLGDNMIRAAKAGEDREHLAGVLAAASVDESTPEAR
jgi:hypothetical protein